MRQTRLAPAPFPRVEPDRSLADYLATLPNIEIGEALDARPHLIHFEQGGEHWLLRGLASDQEFDRVKNRHRVLQHPALVATGIAPTPYPEKSVGRASGALFEIVRSLPGRAWMHNNRMMLEGHSLHRQLPPPEGGLARLSMAVAAVHGATVDLEPGLLPRVTVADYQREQRKQWSELRDKIQATRVQSVHIGRWMSASERVVFASRDVLESVDFLAAQPLVMIHGDLWSAHVLDGPSGIRLVDWGAACFSSPLIDMAQLVGRFAGWGANALEEVVESYLSVRSLTADERRLLPVFGALDLAIETGHLLAEAYIADLDQTSMYAEAARTGAGQMLSSLESIGWSIRKTNPDSKDIRRDSRDRARALREPGQKPRPKKLSSKRPKQ